MEPLSRRVLYHALKESADYDWSRTKFPPDCYSELRHFLFDGLCGGIFSITYGDCRTGFWCRNKFCSNDRLIKFLNDTDTAPMFSEEVYQKIFTDPKKSRIPSEKTKIAIKELSEQDKGEIKRAIHKFDKGKKYLTPARQKRILKKEINSIGRCKVEPRETIVDNASQKLYSSGITKKSHIRHLRKSAGRPEDIVEAERLRQDLAELRRVRNELGLDGVDRGALKWLFFPTNHSFYAKIEVVWKVKRWVHSKLLGPEIMETMQTA